MAMTNIKLTSDQFAVVDVNNKWLDAKKYSPPRGAKMLLIDRKLGVAVLGNWRDADGWTHWCPLPTFDRGEE
jgi:hypothetical protein